MSFVEIPNLPTAGVTAALIGAGAGKSAVRGLESLGVEAIVLPPCPLFAPPVAAHPDMMFCHLGGEKLVYHACADGSVLRRLEEIGFVLIESVSPPGRDYPRDIGLNAARVGNFLICNARFADRAVISYCEQNDLHILSVKQGYAKCSVCVVDERSIVTADAGISAAAKGAGLDVLLINPGFIGLEGYGAGFIGGCCGKLSADTLYFCGDITRHPDYAAVRRFLSERGVEAVAVPGSGELCDIGSIIPLTQKAS